MKQNDGGAAFPESYVGKDSPHEGIGNGMTLRDYFAAKAMQGILGLPGIWENMDDEDLACNAYAIANAMLAERLR